MEEGEVADAEREVIVLLRAVVGTTGEIGNVWRRRGSEERCRDRRRAMFGIALSNTDMTAEDVEEED